MKKRVLLTGASGSMGGEAFKELLRRRDRYEIVILLRPSKVNRKTFKGYENEHGVEIVWGDLCNLNDVMRAMEGIDHVLHPAAFIAPAADKNPPMCRRINFGGTQNLVTAIQSQPRVDDIRFVSVGSVAMYGDRLPPIHMLRVGDPLKPSVGDFYATTKMAAERAVIESGLKYWASIRQTYIAIPNALALMDPIMFHQPVNTHIELITGKDAGYALVQTLEVPDHFYGRVYNIGGGPKCRVVFQDYMERMFKIFGLGDFRKIMPLNWFTLRNFHCADYEDSYILQEYLGHWRQTLEDHYEEVQAVIPWYLKFGASIAPSFAVKMFMRRLADPLKWIKSNDTEKIKAFFGSREEWEKIPEWRTARWDHTPEDRKVLVPEENLEGMQALAASRGGKCLSTKFEGLRTRHKWQCAFGHVWEATPTLHMAGHWCPECAPPPWDYDTQAKKDPALAAVYYNNHYKDEYQKVDYLYCPNE